MHYIISTQRKFIFFRNKNEKKAPEISKAQSQKQASSDP